jgi:hypothetical protein
MVAKWFHTFFRAFVHGNGVVVTTRCLDTQSLELVNASVSAISAFQFSLEWIIRFVRRSINAHDVSGTVVLIVPTMTIAVHAESLMLSAMRASERTKIVREFLFEFWPARGKIRVLIQMGPEGHMALLANVTCSLIIFAIRRVITEWFHLFFCTLVHHDGIHVTT